MQKMARPKGFEPLTPRFVVWCSIQLSYGRPRALLFERQRCAEAGHLELSAALGNPLRDLLFMRPRRWAHNRGS